MRNINPIFTDDEFDELELVKDKHDMNWHDLVYDAILKFKKGE